MLERVFVCVCAVQISKLASVASLSVPEIALWLVEAWRLSLCLEARVLVHHLSSATVKTVSVV